MFCGGRVLDGRTGDPQSFLPAGFSSVVWSAFRYWFLLTLEPMEPPSCRRKCLNCKGLFLPDYRSGQRQRYGHKPDCRKASKRESQRVWLAKPENQNYFRDAQNAERVGQWQKAHPDYWKNTARYRSRTLQDRCPEQTPEQAPAAQAVAPRLSERYLTRPLYDANTSVGGADLQVRRQYLTRGHRNEHPAAANQGTRPSGQGARSET